MLLRHCAQSLRLQYAESQNILISLHLLHFTVIPSAKYILVSLPHAPISIAPSLPRLMTMTGTPTGSTVELNWLPPLHPNGAIHYEIEYKPAAASGDPVNAGNSSSPCFTLSLPNGIETYRVAVVAVNSKGRARSNELEVVVPPGLNTETGILYVHATCQCMLQSHNTTILLYMCADVCMHACVCVRACMQRMYNWEAIKKCT